MAEIICVIGNKGGTGKTTLSHMPVSYTHLLMVMPRAFSSGAASIWS